jgi:hypothetical protein
MCLLAVAAMLLRALVLNREPAPPPALLENLRPCQLPLDFHESVKSLGNTNFSKTNFQTPFIKPWLSRLPDREGKIRAAVANALAPLGQPRWETLAHGSDFFDDIRALLRGGDLRGIEVAEQALRRILFSRPGTEHRNAFAVLAEYPIQPLAKLRAEALDHPEPIIRQTAMCLLTK